MKQALGILLDPETYILYKITLKSVLTTKRDILSLLSSIFNPFRLIALALIKPKWIIQQLWKVKIEWNELLP